MKTTLVPDSCIILALLGITLILAACVPDAHSQAVADNRILAGVTILLAALYVLQLLLVPGKSRAVTDIFLILFSGLLLWEIVSGKLALLDPLLFPGPARVFSVFVTDWQIMLIGVGNSLFILITGYVTALLIAVPSGLYIGWRKRLFDIAYPVAKAVSPIPPTVYLPYAIVLLPTFFMSSVFLIFVASFWPIFVGAVYGVFSIDQRLINSAKTLGLTDHQMVRRILLPGALPSIFSGAMISLIMSFVTLTVAEMIAATSGLGWYIEYHHQFANYDKVIAGMILIAMVVVLIMHVFDRIQRYSLRWQAR